MKIPKRVPCFWLRLVEQTLLKTLTLFRVLKELLLMVQTPRTSSMNHQLSLMMLVLSNAILIKRKNKPMRLSATNIWIHSRIEIIFQKETQHHLQNALRTRQQLKLDIREDLHHQIMQRFPSQKFNIMIWRKRDNRSHQWEMRADWTT